MSGSLANKSTTKLDWLHFTLTGDDRFKDAVSGDAVKVTAKERTEEKALLSLSVNTSWYFSTIHNRSAQKGNQKAVWSQLPGCSLALIPSLWHWQGHYLKRATQVLSSTCLDVTSAHQNSKDLRSARPTLDTLLSLVDRSQPRWVQWECLPTYKL